ncbi:unnamed protein product [Rotaria magnacalcarata]|uniref:Uncharacterized protein n=1 Tax=Rotaria magnacalcarata TaxID=392030 RepID=A0A816NI92_9BILA|nr:unnamed protein product [Rotaria magnacalcarata]
MHSNIDICHRYYWNQSINAKTNWSWICYYYPSQSETQLDHNMIYKAVEEFKATNSKGIRILLRKFDASSDNSSSLNKAINVDLSKYSTWILLFMILLTCICACCYISKKKTKTQQMKISNRSSEQSQYSHATLDDIFTE